MEEEREKEVWARVRGQRGLPVQDCAQCAGVLRYLWKRGIGREITARLMKRQLEQLDLLRGVCRLSGQTEAAWVAADPQGLDDRQATAQCVSLLRNLAASYGRLEGDCAFGGVFRQLAAETWTMTGEMIRLYERMER